MAHACSRSAGVGSSEKFSAAVDKHDLASTTCSVNAASALQRSETTNRCSLYACDAIYAAAEQELNQKFVSRNAVFLQRHLLPGGNITVGGVIGAAATTAQPVLS